MNDNFKFEPIDVDSNEPTNIFLPLSPLFDAAVDDDHLAVQSLLIKNYDVNTKVQFENKIKRSID